MNKVQDTIKLTVYGKAITMTQYYDGSIVAERNEGERWFVMTKDPSDNTFHTQENLDDGNVVEMYNDANICAALAHLALAHNWQPTYFLK